MHGMWYFKYLYGISCINKTRISFYIKISIWSWRYHREPQCQWTEYQAGKGKHKRKKRHSLPRILFSLFGFWGRRNTRKQMLDTMYRVDMQYFFFYFLVGTNSSWIFRGLFHSDFPIFSHSPFQPHNECHDKIQVLLLWFSKNKGKLLFIWELSLLEWYKSYLWRLARHFYWILYSMASSYFWLSD